MTSVLLGLLSTTAAGLRAGVVPLQNHAAHEFSTQFADHHAAGPGGAGEVVIVVAGVLITALVAFYTVRYFLCPGETGAEHIKRSIFEAEDER